MLKIKISLPPNIDLQEAKGIVLHLRDFLNEGGYENSTITIGAPNH